MLTTLLWLLLGLALTYFGAEGFVRGSASLALRLGLTPLVVGLTVVAWGTSAPELLVSVQAAWIGQGGIALGNVVGSNIFNIAVILGLSALILPLRVHVQLVRLDVPVLIGVSLVLLAMAFDDAMGRWEGIILLLGAAAYTWWSFRLARKAAATEAAAAVEADIPVSTPTRHPWLDPLLILGGLGLLVWGASLLVDSAVTLARTWGVSEAVIGLTIVSAGTSLPELATSAVAALRKEADIAVGNVVGSNLYNVLFILGATATIAPIEGSGVRLGDLLMALAAAVVLLPLVRTGFRLDRWEGALLLLGYGVYLWWLWP